MRPPAAFRWLLFAIAAAVIAGCFSGGDDAVPPLNAASFQEAYDRLGAMIERAQAGDADAAQDEYIQAQLNIQSVNAALEELPDAVIIRSELLDAVLLIRRELDDRRGADVLAEHAEDVRSLLGDAAEALGIDPPQGDEVQ